MNASESLSSIRYFGIMFGDRVPPENKHWSLYEMLRGIVNTLESSENTEGDICSLDYLVPDHHALHAILYGSLIYKLYDVLHYKRLIRKNGLMSKICALKFESKNRGIKATLAANSSRVNILQTAATGLQQQLVYHQFTKYQEQYITLG
ncbi:hypothetical protein QAD02_017790 [Eretmocerus hayati]|uniref:Uncharacterized protein n=1 Tax=Eretmocerus hayati TaxID=131215 RepID=A0ACC2PEV0_9HYME|nr:hypothetical protein QAD02_017790 [Eretmocerus hayati]